MASIRKDAIIRNKSNNEFPEDKDVMPHPAEKS